MHNNENVVWQQERDDLWFEYFDRLLFRDPRGGQRVGGALHSISQRFLAGDYDDDVSNAFYFYQLLKIGIVTLYLILFVEFVRHTIDHTALGRPFFTAVLTMVYSELATLGFVEFIVFLWGKYGDINKDFKQKFADVHFALFLTAILNALQYSLTSIFSTRLSHGSWVKTEQLELDHYVEIREEFDRVQEIIDLQYTGCGKWVRNCILFLFRPGLRRRHESLRVQVRFHELRLHFLESNKLSFNLKVSEYLKRSELAILIGLVHVSVGTWVLLIGIINIGYFVLGIIGYTTLEPAWTSKIVVATFVMVNLLFIILSLALRWKMRKIFQTVMKTKIIDKSDHEEGINNQRRLFWFGSPAFVISMIQLMNFGYAISLSSVIIYWEYLIGVDEFAVEVFPIMSIGCYTIFLYNLSALLPEYTLCTSLGYLTNQKELQETVAMHRLEEAKRQRRKKRIENATMNDAVIFQIQSSAGNDTVAQHTGDIDLANGLPPVLKSSVNGNFPGDNDKKAPLLVSDLVKIDTKSLRSNLPEESREILEERRRRRMSRKKATSDGVAAMRAWNQGIEMTASQETNSSSKRIPRRRSRIRKTTSQPGVIQGWQNITLSEGNNRRPFDDIDVDRREKTRRKSNSDPRSIQRWKESLQPEIWNANIESNISSEEEGQKLKEKVAETHKEGNDYSVPKWKIDRQNRLAARKRARKKTQSASAVIQSWQDYSACESTKEKSGTSSDENYNSSDLRALSSDEGSDDNILSQSMNSGFPYKERVKNRASFVTHQSTLRTLKEVEDQCQVSSNQEGDLGTSIDKKIILNLSDAVIIDERKDGNGNDSNTIDTGKSIGNLSDIDVVQAETVGMDSHRSKKLLKVEMDKSWCTLIYGKVRLYFIGPTYQNVSHVVGTSIVFALVGSRVELMFEAELSGNSENWWDMFLFWVEAAFFIMFLIADFIILVSFPICNQKFETERQLRLATLLDILIVGIVLTLFLVAEAQRCCKNYNEEDTFGNVSENFDAIDEDYLLESDCTCPRWGNRTYGGLGMIEPFTSLILLRLFRFWFAHYMIKIFDNWKSKIENTDDPNTPNETMNHDQNDQILHGRDHGHGIVTGSALKLWESAIAEFPDIVEKYGQFSGELLQAMLGLEVGMDSLGASISSQIDVSKSKEIETKKPVECEDNNSHIRLTNSRYAKLPPRAQGIVIAGSLRKPVRALNPEVWKNEIVESSSVSVSKTFLVNFEIDQEKLHSETNASYNFVAPFARLVRSMRRCDRRHLPLLKEWLSVDVVMTQFEIVYFEATDTYDSNLDEETKLHCEACRLALRATKGGKNLRLCDVALGRKVVGHLDFADVTEVHVAKDDVPVSDMTLVEKAAVLFNQEQDLNVEHWSNLCSGIHSSEKYARIIRWALIPEERLKISTNSGTLYFRFYSDLAYFEAKNSGETPQNCHAVERDIAFQWAETISRICGRNQLQQYLPHFGEKNESELLDYLEVVHYHEKEAENERKYFGSQNVGNIELLFVNAKETVLSKKNLIQENAVSTLESRHRYVKSKDGAQRTLPQHNSGHLKTVSFEKDLNSAENQV